MRSLTSIVGIILIVLGIAAFAYQGFSYNKQEQIAQIGDVKITAIKHETVYLPPILGGLALVAGVTLLIFGRRTEK